MKGATHAYVNSTTRIYTYMYVRSCHEFKVKLINLGNYVKETYIHIDQVPESQSRLGLPSTYAYVRDKNTTVGSDAHQSNNV